MLRWYKQVSRTFSWRKAIGYLACEQQTHFRSSLLFPPKNSVCEPEQQNDFRDVKLFVLMLAYQIKG